MFLLLYATWRLHQSSINLGDTSAKIAQMINSRDLILGEVVYIALFYHTLFIEWLGLLVLVKTENRDTPPIPPSGIVINKVGLRISG